MTCETAAVRVLICPDKFAGTLSAVEAAAAIAAGWRAAAPEDQVTVRPLADGGPGFLEVLEAAVGGRLVPAATVDPLGRAAPGAVLVTGERAFLESAQACGLHLLETDERDPKVTTSYGLGLLLLAAVETGAREIVVGLGGSGTNDAGAGMLAALAACAALGGVPRLRGVRLVAATDVDNPLTGLYGASSVYGPQKGANREDVLLLDAALERFARVLEKDLPGCPPGLAGLPGSGAAGGLGAALLAMGGRVTSGIGLVRELTGLDAALDAADLVITGEGSFDEQSLRGKLVSGVAEGARDRGLPCLVLAGRVAAGRREAAAAGVTQAHSLVEHLGTVERAMAEAGSGLTGLAARLAGQWSR